MITGAVTPIKDHRVIHGDAFNDDTYQLLLNDKKAGILFTDPPFDLYDFSWLNKALRCMDDEWAAFICLSTEQVKVLTKEFYDYVNYYYTIMMKPKPNKRIFTPIPNSYHIVHLNGGRKHIRTDKPLYSTMNESYYLNEPGGSRMKHVHQGWAKPPAMITNILSHYVVPGDIILDPFAGSGATIMAAENLGAVCYAIEKEFEQIAELMTNLRMNGLR